MSINPDAHSTREIDLTHWGVEMARKGGVPAKRVLNCFTLQQSALRGSKPTLESRKTKEKFHYGSFTNGTAGPSPTGPTTNTRSFPT